MTELAVIVVSTNEAYWLRRCLPTIYDHAGKIELDVVVVDNESTDETRELVESEFPLARVVRCVNRGFAQANNSALRTLDARFVLFLNPDTEILDGTLAGLVDAVAASGRWSCWRPPGHAGRPAVSNDSAVFVGDPLVFRRDRLGEFPIQGLLAR